MPECSDADGRRIIITANQAGGAGVTAAMDHLRLAEERLAAWQAMGDEERTMVHAVVRQALRRLLESSHWIPDSVRLGPRRLIELDVDRVAATKAANDLDLQLATAREELAAAMAALEDFAQ